MKARFGPAFAVAFEYLGESPRPIAVDNETPLDSLLEREEARPEDPVRVAAGEMLRWLFGEWETPMEVLRRGYLVCKQYAPELIGNASDAKLASMLAWNHPASVSYARKKIKEKGADKAFTRSRSAKALELVAEGVSQGEAARRLGITKQAVSDAVHRRSRRFPK